MRILFILFATLALASAMLAQAARARVVITTVNVGNSPFGVAYDSGKGEVFVANQNSDTTSVISDATNTVVATVNVGSHPYGAAYDSAKGEVYVTNADDNTVSMISDANDTVVATMNVGIYPRLAAYDSAKGEVFVTNGDDNTVSVISSKASSSTSVECFPSPVSIGSPTACTATVIGLSPVGSVTFTQSGTGGVIFPSLPTCTLSAETCQITGTAIAPGTLNITATYGGDPNDFASSGFFSLGITSVTQTVTATTTVTSTITTTQATISTTTTTTTSTQVAASSATTYAVVGVLAIAVVAGVILVLIRRRGG